MKNGSIVKLKSGGPKMTIEFINKDSANCIWFDKKQLCRNQFYLHSLELNEANFDNDDDDDDFNERNITPMSEMPIF